jgi:putative membrane protein
MRELGALLSAFHLLALALGLGSIWSRGRLLAGTLDADRLRRVFRADGVWGIAAALWLLTGALRAFAGFEKGTGFYVGSWLFHLKLGLFLLVVALEILPMVALIRWRKTSRRGGTPDLSKAPLYALLSRIQLSIVIAIVFVASFMARGYGRMGG